MPDVIVSRTVLARDEATRVEGEVRRLTRPEGDHPRGVVHRSEEERVERASQGIRASAGVSCCAGRPVAAAGLSAAGALAGCENTTTPIGAETPRARRPSAAAELVVPKPLGPAGLPLPRPDNSVTWAITDENKPIADGVKPEAGPLRIYNYADYVDPATVKKFQKQFDTKVQIATYNSSDEAIAKLASGAVELRPGHGPERLEHRRPDRAASC